MTVSFIRSDDFPAFVDALIGAGPVYGPVAKRPASSSAPGVGRGAAARLRRHDSAAQEGVLPAQAGDRALRRGLGAAAASSRSTRSCSACTTTTCAAIDMTDFLFRERNEDWNYLAQREATTIVASNVQKVAPRAFWASMIGTEVEPQGHDAFLTKIDGGYVLRDAHAQGRGAAGARRVPRGDRRRDRRCRDRSTPTCSASARSSCRTRAPRSPAKVRESFGNEELWDELADGLLQLRLVQHRVPHVLLLRHARHLEPRSEVRARGPATGTRA